MAVIDFEAAWYALKAHIQEKRSHGAAELAEAMAQIEVENLLDETQAGYDDRPRVRHGGSDRPVSAGEAVESPSGEHAAQAA